MEIYTGDFIDIASEFGEKITKEINQNPYIAVDECCNLQKKIRTELYNRFTIVFNDLIERSKISEVDLEKELFKMINEL